MEWLPWSTFFFHFLLFKTSEAHSPKTKKTSEAQLFGRSWQLLRPRLTTTTSNLFHSPVIYFSMWFSVSTFDLKQLPRNLIPKKEKKKKKKFLNSKNVNSIFKWKAKLTPFVSSSLISLSQVLQEASYTRESCLMLDDFILGTGVSLTPMPCPCSPRCSPSHSA